MRCTKCGLENPDNNVYCANCGAPLPKEQNGTDLFTGSQAQQSETQIQPPYYTQAPWQSAQPSVPESYKPITPLGYVGYSLLFSIPLVGIILLFVFSFGGTANINLKNFSRGMLISVAIGIVLVILFSLIFGTAFTQYYDQYGIIGIF